MKKIVFQNKLICALCALASCALWGISTPIVKLGYVYTDASHVPSLLLWAGVQFLAAGLITLVIDSVACKKVMFPKRKNIKGVILISLTQTVVQYTLLYVGLLYTTSVKGAILKSTDVFIVMLLASLLFRMEKLTARKIASCLIGFVGIIIMNLDGLNINFNLGDGLVVLAIVSYSFGVILTKLFAKDEDPIVLCGWQMALGGVIMSLIGLIGGGSFDVRGLAPIILILSAIYAVSYVLWTLLLKYNDASKISIYSFSTPIFGALFSALLLSEASGVAPLNLVIALVLVCTGILLG